MKTYIFFGTCIDLNGDAINAMKAGARQIGYRTMLKHCEGLLRWATSVRYDKRKNKGLTLRDDTHVGYFKSHYKGAPCYYVAWSAIEHVWLPTDVALEIHASEKAEARKVKPQSARRHCSSPSHIKVTKESNNLLRFMVWGGETYQKGEFK
jgi:hypothetical protein